jgi:hypothetical protein
MSPTNTATQTVANTNQPSGSVLHAKFDLKYMVPIKALPSYLHVSTIGFAAVIGVGGGATLPFAIGSLAQAKGLGVLQPIILTVLTVVLVLWLCFPKTGRRGMEAGVSLPSSEEPGKWWLNIGFDLVETGKDTIARARGC